MTLSIKRFLSISAIVLISTLGVTSCSANGDSNSSSSMSKAESISKDKGVKGVTQTLDNFFETLSKETITIKSSKKALPSEKTSQEDAIAFYKKNYPKSLKFISEGMDEEYTVMIFNHLTEVVSKSDDFKAKSIEDAVTVQSAEGVTAARIENTGFKVFMNGENQSQSVSKEAIGSLTLRYSDGSGWKIDSSSIQIADIATCIEGSNQYNTGASSTNCQNRNHAKTKTPKSDATYKARFGTK